MSRRIASAVTLFAATAFTDYATIRLYQDRTRRH
jgi:hypothetical protein